MADDRQQTKLDLNRLRSYIQQGRIKKIRYLLNDHSKRMNEFFEHKFDACALATKFKQEKALRLVHDCGFPIDGYPNTHSVTSLIIAIRRSDLAFIRTLVELGCDVNCAVRSYTIIPLIEAYKICKNKQENLFLFEKAKEIFEYLLQSGASPNVYNIHNMRLTHLTVIDGKFDFTELLLDNGAYINAITTTHRKNLLHLICDGSVEQSTENLLHILRLFIQRGGNINQRDDVFETPLMCTLHHGGNLQLAYELIIEGTHLDLKNNFGNTYLTRAVHYALYDHARMALYAGAPCRARQCTFPYTNRNYQKQQESQTTDDDTSLMNAIVDYEHFISEFERYLLKPRQLKDIARIHIRRHLPLPLSKTMIQLQEYLPHSLIQYLMLNEMKNILNIAF